MSEKETIPYKRLLGLVLGIRRPPPGRFRIALAIGYGAVCHLLFAIAVVSMMVAMFFGMSEGLGSVPSPWYLWANAALILQFPLAHSLLLTNRGRKLLSALAPGGHGKTLATTTYAIIASAQLILLFVLWTPSGIVWWRAEGGVFWLLCTLYAAAWLLLIKASYDAGAEVQSGALGWMSLMQNIRPIFPDMPINGLFRFVRQPIYLSFALTLWTVPVWTPDQLAIASAYTIYCVFAPLLKERRFVKIYGERFRAYRSSIPYMIPKFAKKHDNK